MVKVVPDGPEFIVWDDQAGKELGRYKTQSQASYNANLLQYQQNNQRDDQNQAQRAQKWGEANNPAAPAPGTQQVQTRIYNGIGPQADQWKNGPSTLSSDTDKNAWLQFKQERGLGKNGMDDPWQGWDPTKDLFKTSYGGDQEKQGVWNSFIQWYKDKGYTTKANENMVAAGSAAGSPYMNYDNRVQQGYSTGIFNYQEWLKKRRNGWI